MKVVYTQAAETSLYSMNPQDHKAVLGKIKHFATSKPGQLSTLKIMKLHGFEPPVFSVRATKDLRILFRYVQKHSVEILDIARRERIKRIYRQLAERREI